MLPPSQLTSVVAHTVISDHAETARVNRSIARRRAAERAVESGELVRTADERG